jgi:ADP-ribose pyrophosphatase YjhB (NUDIX family)
MRTRSDLNDIQAGIVRELFFHDNLRFAEVNADNLPSDQFSYHLRQLIKYGLIEKTPENTYRLSTLGRTRAIMLYPTEGNYIEQGFLAVRLLLTKEENGQQLFLMQKRSAVPFQGTYATPGDKILFGEDAHVAAKRAMHMQTDLECDVELKGVKHYKDNYLGKIVQDKYFFIFRATDPRGTLKPKGRTGENVWLPYDKATTSPPAISGARSIIDTALGDQFTFEEKTFMIDEY